MIAIILAVAAIWLCRYILALLRFAVNNAPEKGINEYTIIATMLLVDLFVLGIVIGFGAYKAYELIFT